MGGGEIALLNLATHLDRRRFEPVVVLASDGPLRQKLGEAGVETHLLPLSSEVTGVRKDSLGGASAVSRGQIGEILRYAWRLRNFARARGAHILHTNSLKADIIGALSGRLGGIPVVWHVRDRIADDYLPSLATRVFRNLCRWLPDYLAVNSAATLESLQLPAARRARVLVNGLIHDGMPPLQPGDAALDASMEAPRPADEPLIGLVGRISPWKGQDIFLRAAATVLEKYPRAQFQIIGAPLFGEEALERELHELARQLGIENSVQWLGFRSDVLPLVAQMTMLAHASTLGEPFGQVVVEAMMVGRPVVATRGGGVPEVVVDGKTGLLVPMKDAPAMAAAMLCLLDDPALCRAMGEAGQKRAAGHFTIGHTVAKVSRLYDDVRRASEHHKERVRRGQWFLLGVVGVMLLSSKIARRFSKAAGKP